MIEADVRNELIAEVRRRWPAWDVASVERALHFYDLLLDENGRQNLTRLTSPTDFLDGHLADVAALIESGLVSYPAMDLGSGCGVPGLLMACFDQKPWVLVDSEARKAEFLERARLELGLREVLAFAGRGEEILLRKKVESVVARAVGPVERVFAWIGKCSTWNTLVLLKGPGWSDEWMAFSRGRYRRKLRIAGEFNYVVGPEKRERRIVRLERVPRGTIAPMSSQS